MRSTNHNAHAPRTYEIKTSVNQTEKERIQRYASRSPSVSDYVRRRLLTRARQTHQLDPANILIAYQAFTDLLNTLHPDHLTPDQHHHINRARNSFACLIKHNNPR